MNRALNTSIIALVALALGGATASPASARGKKGKKKIVLPMTAKRAFDVTPIRSLLQLATDGKGRYIAFVRHKDRKQFPKKWQRGHALFYSADGKAFHLNRVGISAGSPIKYSYDFRDPRHADDGSRGIRSIVFTKDNGDTLTVQCDERKTPFKRMDPAAATPILDKATWEYRPFNRTPTNLARDDRGVYYLVDNAMWPEHAKDFRVYRGMRGAMKFLPLKGVADDSAGQVFSTRKGHLRYVVKNPNSDGKQTRRAEWIKGNRRTKLTVLPLWPNLRLIYEELGPYIGLRQGTPCDDL